MFHYSEKMQKEMEIACRDVFCILLEYSATATITTTIILFGFKFFCCFFVCCSAIHFRRISKTRMCATRLRTRSHVDQLIHSRISNLISACLDIIKRGVCLCACVISAISAQAIATVNNSIHCSVLRE